MYKVLLISIFCTVFLECKQEKKIEQIEISPPNASVEQFSHLQMKANVIYDDNSIDTISSVNWQSSDTAIAKINSSGTIKGIKIGLVTISAALNGFSNHTSISVIENSLFNKDWELISIQNVVDSQWINYPDSISTKITILFDNGQILTTDSIGSVLGFSGICNYGRGNCVIDDNKIKFPNGIFTTKLYCKYFVWEEILLDNLSAAYEYVIDKNHLLIKSKSEFNLYFTKTL